jgi:2-polyprenyl-3-methyl-5-hydroxy-6-metoxy-1,4-benzoquinol methylase
LKCPLCKNDTRKSFPVTIQEAGPKRRLHAYSCLNCGLVFLENYQEDRNFMYDDNYTVWGKATESAEVIESKREAFRHQLASLKKFINPKGKRLLDIGTGNGYLLDVAKEMGFDCYGLDVSEYSCSIAKQRFPGRIFNGPMEKARYKAKFDVITMTDILEHIHDPHSFFQAVIKNLKPGGYVLVITPDTDSTTRVILGRNWFQYKYEHVLCWNGKSIRQLMSDFGLRPVFFRTNIKRFNLEYYRVYFTKYSIFLIGDLFNAIYSFIPKKLRKRYFNNPLTGEMLLIARYQSHEKEGRRD